MIDRISRLTILQPKDQFKDLAGSSYGTRYNWQTLVVFVKADAIDPKLVPANVTWSGSYPSPADSAADWSGPADTTPKGVIKVCLTRGEYECMFPGDLKSHGLEDRIVALYRRPKLNGVGQPHELEFWVNGVDKGGPRAQPLIDWYEMPLVARNALNHADFNLVNWNVYCPVTDWAIEAFVYSAWIHDLTLGR